MSGSSPAKIDVAAGPYAGRTLIVMNPAAGHTDPARLRRLIGGAFAARGAAFDLVETEGAAHATELAAGAVDLGYRAVCVVGGDGTIAEAAHGLSGSDIPLAVIPRGTANQVAHNLSIPLDVDGAVEVAVSGRPQPLDLGVVNGRSFALVAGAGFDAAVMASATRALKERWGFAAYVYAAVKSALTASPAEFVVDADGTEVRVRAVSVMLANVGELFSPFLPFAFSLAPQPTRSWQDGLLDVVIVAPRGLAGVAPAILQSLRRHFHGDHLIHLQAREVAIQAEPPMAAQVDGDAAGTTPLRATVVPGGIRVMVPA